MAEIEIVTDLLFYKYLELIIYFCSDFYFHFLATNFYRALGAVSEFILYHNWHFLRRVLAETHQVVGVHLFALLVGDGYATEHLHGAVEVVLVTLVEGHVLVPVLLRPEQAVAVLELYLARIKTEALDREGDPGEAVEDVVQHEVVAEHGDRQTHGLGVVEL